MSDGLTDLGIFTVVIDTLAVLAIIIVTWKLLRRWRRKHPKANRAIETAEAVSEPKVLHRCPNPKCNKQFEIPWKEMVYVPRPPRERLICPICKQPLTSLTVQISSSSTSPTSLPPTEVEFDETPNPETPTQFAYTLTVELTKIGDIAERLAEKGLKLNITGPYQDKSFQIHVTSQTPKSFNKLKTKGEIIDWKQTEPS